MKIYSREDLREMGDSKKLRWMVDMSKSNDIIYVTDINIDNSDTIMPADKPRDEYVYKLLSDLLDKATTMEQMQREAITMEREFINSHNCDTSVMIGQVSDIRNNLLSVVTHVSALYKGIPGLLTSTKPGLSTAGNKLLTPIIRSGPKGEASGPNQPIRRKILKSRVPTHKVGQGESLVSAAASNEMSELEANEAEYLAKTSEIPASGSAPTSAGDDHDDNSDNVNDSDDDDNDVNVLDDVETAPALKMASSSKFKIKGKVNIPMPLASSTKVAPKVVGEPATNVAESSSSAAPAPATKPRPRVRPIVKKVVWPSN